MIYLPNLTLPSTCPDVTAYADRILARSDLLGWWQASDAALVKTSGAETIFTLNSLKPGGSGFSQSNTTARPTLTPAAINGFKAATFDGGDYLPCGDPLAALASGPFTIVALVRLAQHGSTQTIFSKRVDNASRIILDAPANNQQIRAVIGNASRGLNTALGGWLLAVMASDGLGTGQLRVNGIDAASFSHDNNIGAATPAIGSLSATATSFTLAAGAQLSNLLIFTSYHPAQAGLLSLIERHMVETYALGFTPAL